MGVVENIMAGVILMMTFFIAGLLYMSSFAQDAVINSGRANIVFQNDQRLSDVEYMMKITEPESRRSIGILLADAIYYRNDTFIFNNKSVNVTKKMKDILRMSFVGNNSYYLEIRPRIIEVSLNFIIDGSPSLQQEREKLAANLEDIMLNVEAKINQTNEGYDLSGINLNDPVITTIYILGNKREKCDLFNNLTGAGSKIHCIVIDGTDIYLRNETINTSSLYFEHDRFNLRAFKETYNMTPPFGVGYENTTDHYAKEYDYYESDWGYGTAYASNFDNSTTLARLTLLFPMGDELSTSSIADECFWVDSYQEWIVCSLCQDTCPVERSMRSILKGIEVASDNNHIINPIFSYSCDYIQQYFFGLEDYSTADQDSGFNGYDTFNSYTRSFGVDGGRTLCDNSGCGGCTHDPVLKDICFHPGCSADILSQMQQMADATGGQVINLQNISTMDIIINNTITKNLEQYSIKIGKRNESRNRDVIETNQPLPNGQVVDVRLWVYKDDE